MPKTKNIAIGCIALVALGGAIAACAVGGVFVLGLTGVADKAENEGVEFGKQTDQQGCQDEAFRRLRTALRSNDLLKRRERLFLYGCFQTCKDTRDFCATAPTKDAYVANSSWSSAQCEKRGLGNEDVCEDLFMEVASVCLGKTPRRGN